MVDNPFFAGSKYLVEDNDGRHDYLRLDGDRFLDALAAAGRKVRRAPFDAPDAKEAYLSALVRVNDRYFAAREYEADAEGKYFKHDERAERRFRVRTAARFSDCVEDLRALLAAHEGLLETAVEWVERRREVEGRGEAASDAGAASDADDGNGTVRRVRSTVLACTDRAIGDGWFPVVEAYYRSLSPGELVAEDRERRNQRIEGTEASRGVRELLARPGFERLTRRDFRRVRELERASPGADSRVWKRLLEDYPWLVANDRDDSGVANRESPGT